MPEHDPALVGPAILPPPTGVETGKAPFGEARRALRRVMRAARLCGRQARKP